MNTIAIVMSARLFGSLQNFLITALVIRLFPETESAAYIYCFLVGNLVLFFGLTSLEPLIMRRVHEAQDKDRMDFSPYMWAGLVLTMIPYGLCVMYFAAQTGRPAALEAFLYCAVWIASTALSSPSSYLRARLDLRREAANFLIPTFVFAVIKVALLLNGVSPKYLFLVFAFEALAITAMNHAAPLARSVRFFGLASVREVFATARAGLPYVAAVGLGNIYFRIALLVFGPLLTDSQLEVVGVVGQLITAAGLLTYSLIQTVYPIQQRLADEERRFRLLLSGLFAVCVGWGVCVGLGLLVAGDWFVHLVFEKFEVLTPAMIGLLAAHLSLQTMVNVRNNAVLIKGSSQEVMVINGLALLLGFLAALALTPIASVTGYMWAITATALAGLAAGFATPTGRRYAGEILGWLGRDKLWPSVRAIHHEFTR
jgi:O-antigen/teichoic acid export membrane protein